MKKILYALVMVSLISGLTAMEGDNRADKEGGVPTSLLNSETIIAGILENPENVVVKSTGFLGMGGSVTLVTTDAVTSLVEEHVGRFNRLQGENDALRKELEKQDALSQKNAALLKEIEELRAQNAQLLILKQLGLDVVTAQRALKEAQEAKDAEARKNAELQEQLREQKSDAEAKEAAYESVIEEKVQWLREADKFKLEQTQSKAREEALIEETRNLRETVKSLTASKDELEKANAELDTFKKALESEKAKGEQTNDQKCKSLEEAIAKKDAKVKDIEQENARLLKEKEESEALIANLKKAQTGSDHYSRLIEKARDRKVSDDDLVLDLMATKIFLGVDLDELSQGHDLSLARAILEVSCPFGPRPANAQNFKGCWRHVGNYLLDGNREFVWVGGTPTDYNAAKFKNTRLEKKLTEAAQSAMRTAKVK